MRLITVLLVITAHALGQLSNQGCTGQTNDSVQEGGDPTILHWSSLKRVKVPESLGKPAVYVFERQVQNNSNRAITDVHWPVANYEKDEIPAHEPRCDWTTGWESKNLIQEDRFTTVSVRGTSRPRSMRLRQGLGRQKHRCPANLRNSSPLSRLRTPSPRSLCACLSAHPWRRRKQDISSNTKSRVSLRTSCLCTGMCR